LDLNPRLQTGRGFSRFLVHSYTSGGHTVFHHRYHIVWITKYRYTVLEGALRERIRTIIRQVCKELGVQIVSGVLSREHVHMFVEIPPHIAVSDFVRRVKGRSSHRVQMEFPDLRKRTWGARTYRRQPVVIQFTTADASGRTMIGRGATMIGTGLDITIENLQKMRVGEAHAYLWGRFDYDDVFANTQRYRTSFASKSR
jgi:putative transposase